MIHTSMFQKHIHKVKIYPSVDDFTQALLVMLVTNIMSAERSVLVDILSTNTHLAFTFQALLASIPSTTNLMSSKFLTFQGLGMSIASLLLSILISSPLFFYTQLEVRLFERRLMR